MAAVVGNESGSCVAVRAARVCDVCGVKGAIWFCAADEAHLCTGCDTQVHSANAVSRRHERVRLSPDGTVQSRAISHGHLVPSEDGSGKRKRSSRPYSHHLRKLTRLSNQLMEDNNRRQSFEAELELFDFLDVDDVVDVGNQEVPSMSLKSSSPSCSASDLSSDFAADREGDHSADSLAPFFKGKAALCSPTVALNADVDDHFHLVPDAGLGNFVDIPEDTNVDLAPVDDAFFFPGDIPGLESFVPEIQFVDDFALSFDLALQNDVNSFEQNNYSSDSNNSGCASDTTVAPQSTMKATEPTTSPHSDFLAGPFAKFFAQKSSQTSENSQTVMDSERIKQEARAMLQSCAGEDEAAQKQPLSLQLNLTDVLAAWSDREEPWIVASAESDDAGLVPDMDGDRDARVLRYKEKRRNRLFSKTIRYEVRKLNAERRPRMKGRFVKRTPTAIATC